MSQRIKVSSAQRTIGTPGSYRIDFREAIEAGRYRLNELFVCNSYYNVTANNNVVYWYEIAGLGNTSAIVAPGIYSAAALATAVAAAMTAITTTGSVFTGVYSATTGKITFTSVLDTPIVFLGTTLNSIGELIGFAGGETSVGSLQANVAPLLSININIGSSTEIRDSKSNAYTFVVPIDKPVGSYVLYNAKVNYDQVADLSRAMTLVVQVVDDDNAIVPLLLDWYFILEKVG